MPVMTIACERCDELRARFEHSGDLVVLGCDPDPSNPGLCRLRYERHAATLPPAGAAATLTPDPEAHRAGHRQPVRDRCRAG
jgi:hypothetical protein